MIGLLKGPFKKDVQDFSTKMKREALEGFLLLPDSGCSKSS